MNVFKELMKELGVEVIHEEDMFVSMFFGNDLVGKVTVSGREGFRNKEEVEEYLWYTLKRDFTENIKLALELGK